MKVYQSIYPLSNFNYGLLFLNSFMSNLYVDSNTFLTTVEENDDEESMCNVGLNVLGFLVFRKV